MKCFKNTHLIFLVCLFTSIYSGIQADRIFVEKITNEHVIPFFKSKELIGLAVVVFYNQQGYIFSYGKADREKSIPVTPDTIFRIGSITKTFTALELALQVNKGRMFLNDPITKYFPALRGRGAIKYDLYRNNVSN